MVIKTDIVILGSGAGALQTARILAEKYQVHIITKSDVTNGSSYKAQGGIAAVTGKEDGTSLHMQDTLHAGVFHHDEENVKKLV